MRDHAATEAILNTSGIAFTRKGVDSGVLLAAGVGVAAGEFAAVDPTLERLLGRPPMSFRDLLEAHLSQTK